jgi:hypothetical protein
MVFKSAIDFAWLFDHDASWNHFAQIETYHAARFSSSTHILAEPMAEFGTTDAAE